MPNARNRRNRQDGTMTVPADTGAERSSITQKVVSSLNLGTSGFIKVNSIHGSISRTRVVKVRIKLQNIDITEIINPTVLGLVRGIDLVIGMDIIRLGDAAISNGFGETWFTFTIPPFEDKVDLYKKAIASPKGTVSPVDQNEP